MKTKIGYFLSFLAIIITMLFGAVYFFYPSYLPHHAELTNSTWDEVPPELQRLIRMLMMTIGGLTISLGLFLSMILFSYIKTKKLLLGNFFFIGGIIGTLIVAVPNYMYIESYSNPPLFVSTVLIALFIGGYLLTRKSF